MDVTSQVLLKLPWPYLLKHGEVYATEGHGTPCSRHSIRITVSVEHLEAEKKEGTRER